MRRISCNWLLGALLLLVVSACSRSTPEQVLRLQITQMQQGIEQREAARVIEPLADDFLGNGGMDRQAVERLLRAQLLLNQRIEVVLGPVDVRIEGQNAQADFTVVLAGGNGRLYERGRIHQVSTHWREQDGQWLLYRAQWGDGQQQ